MYTIFPFREVRKKMGLAQWQVANLFDATQTDISKLERGLFPTEKFLKKYRRVFDVDWRLSDD